MIKRKFITFALSAALLAPCFSVANAKSGVFVKAGIGQIRYGQFKKGAAVHNDDNIFTANGKPKSSALYSVGPGYEFNKFFDIELNLLQTKTKTNANYIGTLPRNRKMKTIAAFLNGYYHLPLSDFVKPYLTAGIGGAKNTTSSAQLGEDICEKDPVNCICKGVKIVNLAWTVGAGLKVNFNSRLGLDLGYRYFDFGKAKIKSTEYDPLGMGDKDDFLRINGASQKVRGHTALGSLVYHF